MVLELVANVLKSLVFVEIGTGFMVMVKYLCLS